ncbi:MAG TPA: hypothetical protein VH328_16570, partial [Burkholderiaceae bacterium]|nr:hypothetical protein [Burkholderiaceae bacterium]
MESFSSTPVPLPRGTRHGPTAHGRATGTQAGWPLELASALPAQYHGLLEPHAAELAWLAGKGYTASDENIDTLHAACRSGDPATVANAIKGLVRAHFQQRSVAAIAAAKSSFAPNDAIVRFVAESLLDEHGAWDPTAMTCVLDFLRVGEHGLPSLLRHHMIDCIGMLATDARCTVLFQGITRGRQSALHPDGLELIKRCLRGDKPGQPITAFDVQHAALVALLSLVRQSALGSCWITFTQSRSHAGLGTTPEAVRELRLTLRDIKSMLTRGKLPVRDENGKLRGYPLNLDFSMVKAYGGGQEEKTSDPQKRIHELRGGVIPPALQRELQVLEIVLDKIGYTSSPMARARLIDNAIEDLPQGRNSQDRRGTFFELVFNAACRVQGISPALAGKIAHLDLTLRTLGKDLATCSADDRGDIRQRIARTERRKQALLESNGISADVGQDIRRVETLAKDVYASCLANPILKCREW